MIGFLIFICGIFLFLFLIMLSFILWGWSIIRGLQDIDKPER